MRWGWLGVVGLMGIMVGGVRAEDRVRLILDPGSKTNMTVGERVTVRVKINSGAGKVSYFRLKMAYDAAVMEILTGGVKINTESGFAAMEKKTQNGQIWLSGTFSGEFDSLPTGEFEIGSFEMKLLKDGVSRISLFSSQIVGRIVATGSGISYGVDFLEGSFGGVAENGVDGVLNFKTSFFGIGPNSTCARNMKADVVVRSEDGEMKTYRDVSLAEDSQRQITLREVGEKDVKVFSGRVLLEGMGQKRDRLAVFVKGGKTLQVKYGKNNQTDLYNQAGGEISVTTSAASSPVYDFAGYPVLMGDVVGEGGVQDGVVDGRDFSFVKRQTELTLARGGNLKADLNEDCILNSFDGIVLMQSLRERQEQLY